MEKLVEHTYGGHIYMKIGFDNGRTEEIDVFFDKDGKETFKTTADDRSNEARERIINAFNRLY